MRRILTEASGSLTAAWLINAIRAAGHSPVASDLSGDCAGRYLADDFVLMPAASVPDLWQCVPDLLTSASVDTVIPSLDESLMGWAEHRAALHTQGIEVVVSPPESVKLCRDKWATYEFFVRHGIPTPRTSLKQDYPLIKPRDGRGSQGVRVTSDRIQMDGLIAQELLQGEEYTVDVFCDRNHKPVYIVPRRRLGVRDGKSTGGVVVRHEGIEQWVRRICALAPFLGPINLQCFVEHDGSVKFVEINPRIAGGMALGFAATENWITLMVDHILDGVPVRPRTIHYGMTMYRCYQEVFVPNVAQENTG